MLEDVIWTCSMSSCQKCPTNFKSTSPRLGIDSIKLKHSSTEVKSRSLDCINKAYLGARVNFVAFGFIVHSIRAKLNPVNLPLRPPLQN